MFNIPLSAPSINEKAWEYVKNCLDTEWVSSAGEYVDLFEEKIASYTGSKYAIACINGTSAIQLSLKLIGVEQNDEVIVPTITFIAPINAVAYNGASPIFMDVDEFYNIDAAKVIDFINNETTYKNGFTYNNKTKNKITALIPVHVWGNAVWLDELLLLCQERNIKVLEDASESLGTFYNKGKCKSKHTGTIGMIGCLSFNGNKIITSGGGGMILTDNHGLAEKAKYMSKQAKDDKVKYIHNEIGYNYRLSNIQAALGVAQLEELPKFLKNKRRIHHEYIKAIENIEGLSIANTPNYSDNNHWMNLIKIDSAIYRRDWQSLHDQFKIKGIQTRPVWTMNHLQRPYKNCQSFNIENAQKLYRNSLCIPSSSNLNNDEIGLIVDVLNE